MTKELQEKSDDDLIKLIADNVNVASYKVAQCCVLYMRGYYCGIMPVDSEEFIDVVRFDTNIMSEKTVQEKVTRLVLK